MQSRITIAGFLAVLVLACSMIFADGDSRKSTPGEKEFGKSALDVIVKAVSVGPEGWETAVNSRSDIQILYTEINEPMRLEYHVEWQDKNKTMAGQAQMAQEMMNLAKKPGFSEKDVEALTKKMEPHDANVRIDVLTNINSQGINEKVAPAAAIAGGLVYKSESGYRTVSWIEGSTYVFLGSAWKMGTSTGTYVNFTPVKKATSSTVIQNMVVKIRADAKRSEQLIQKIDWESLQKLISK
jgi:hypothetical protein